MSLNSTREYTLHMRPLLNKRALYSDETEMFLSPMECDPGDRVTIRFRTAQNNVDAVYLRSGDLELPMHLEENVDGFDYYAVQVEVGAETFAYHFKVVLGNTVCFYHKQGVVDHPEERYLFRIIPGFHTPDWAKGAVMYQIYVDRFRNGDPTNDVVTDEYSYINQHVRKVENWQDQPATMDVGNFYGGDLAGVLEKMDYLQGLGVEVLYLNPIFVSPSNHKYDIQDYENIDPHFGVILHDCDTVLAEGDNDNRHAKKHIMRVTNKENLDASNDLFRRLVQEAHNRGMKVILDGVFNHSGSFNKWLDRELIYENEEGYAPGAYVSADSPYRSYYQFHDQNAWPYNKSYDGWWGHDTLPKMNYEDSPELEEAILNVGRKWVSEPYCADGWRLDVAADLGHSPEYNHLFWKKFRDAVKEANPNAIILAEHYGDPSSWLQGDEWDTVMNYDAFMEPVSWFLTGMEKHSDAYREDLFGNSISFVDAMRYHMASFSMPSLLTAMNELDNHDHSRFLTRTNHVVGRLQSVGAEAATQGTHKSVLREAVLMQMTWPGAPTLYYGDEAGVAGFTDPDNRRTYPWGCEDHELIDFYRKAIHMHREHEVLKTGSVMLLHYDYQVLVYARFNRDEQIIVAVNNMDRATDCHVNIWPAGISRMEEQTELTRLFLSHKDGFDVQPEKITAEFGRLYLELPPLSVTVWKHEKSQ